MPVLQLALFLPFLVTDNPGLYAWVKVIVALRYRDITNAIGHRRGGLFRCRERRGLWRGRVDICSAWDPVPPWWKLKCDDAAYRGRASLRRASGRSRHGRRLPPGRSSPTSQHIDLESAQDLRQEVLST